MSWTGGPDPCLEHSAWFPQRQNQNNLNPCPPPPAASGSKDPRIWRDRTKAEGSQGARDTGPGDSESGRLPGILAPAATNSVSCGFLNHPIAPWHGASTVPPSGWRGGAGAGVLCVSLMPGTSAWGRWGVPGRSCSHQCLVSEGGVLGSLSCGAEDEDTRPVWRAGTWACEASGGQADTGSQEARGLDSLSSPGGEGRTAVNSPGLRAGQPRPEGPVGTNRSNA